VQQEADRRYAGVAGPLWRVELGGWPRLTLPAADRTEATARYFGLVGVVSSVHQPQAELVEDYPHEILECGLKELPRGD
jgi:hypothetical protein